MKFLCILAFMHCFSSFTLAGTLPKNWRDFIDPDILNESGNDQSRYNADMWEGDVSSLELDERPVNVAANAMDKGELAWPNNTIPYVFTKERSVRFRVAQRTKISEAMDIMMHLTGQCVKFVERTSEKDYVKFQKGYQCFSDIGRTGGKQVLSLSSRCLEHYGCIQHELMHVLGFFHEHSRLDRDDHVTINWDNIAAENKGQFAKHAGQTYGLPYDYESVMHYEVKAFAADEKLPTIVPTVRKTKLGQKENLSSLDVARIFRHFKCGVPSGLNFVNSQSSVNSATPESFCSVTSTESSTRPPTESATNEEISRHCPTLPSHEQKVAENGPSDMLRMEPFPDFSSEPKSREQCAAMVNANCNRGSADSCLKSPDVSINCDKQVTSGQLQGMALAISKGPLRAILVTLFDGDKLSVDNFAVIRKQIIGLEIVSCVSDRTTAKLPQLQFLNLLSFNLSNCYAMSIKRNDFARSLKLREIVLENTTTVVLERGTFTDLPALRLLSLERGFHQMSAFSVHVRDYLKRIHCSCEFAWFRRWWNANWMLLRKAAQGEVYIATRLEVPNGLSALVL